MALKKKYNHDLSHDITILIFIFILGYASWWIWEQDKKLDLKEQAIIAKQQEINIAWNEVNKAQLRKAKLEEEASETEAKIAKAEKKFNDMKAEYKRIDRIQKDLVRIIGQ